MGGHSGQRPSSCVLHILVETVSSEGLLVFSCSSALELRLGVTSAASRGAGQSWQTPHMSRGDAAPGGSWSLQCSRLV